MITVNSENYHHVIFNVVCDFFKVTADAMAGKSRNMYLVMYRQIYCGFAYKKNMNSFSKVGELINRKHCDIIHSVKMFNDRNDKFFVNEKNNIEKIIDSLGLNVEIDIFDIDKFYIYKQKIKELKSEIIELQKEIVQLEKINKFNELCKLVS